MNILCPECYSSTTLDDNSLILECHNCGLKTDLSGIGTWHGMGTIPLLLDLKGEVIGDYKLEELIGIGGMGVVYRAIGKNGNSPVALKVLNYNHLHKNEFIARFEREAEALKRLEHPNIVKVLDSGRQDDIYYIVTEYLEGENLLTYLRTHSPDKKEILRIIIEVSKAIEHAHEQGIIHRDIKPANIFISDKVKVLDFGLAQLTGADSQLSSLTRSDMAMGTINYLSPEQRINAKSIDERSDIFSIGVVFYEMLTGTLPMGRFKPPSRINKKLNRRFDRIVEACLNASPSQRYQKVKDLLKELNDLKEYVPVRKGFIKTTAIILIAVISFVLFFKYDGPELIQNILAKSAEKIDEKTGSNKATDISMIPLPDTLPHEMKDPHLVIENKAEEKVSKVSKKEVSKAESSKK